jgi:hypothetical protein
MSPEVEPGDWFAQRNFNSCAFKPGLKKTRKISASLIPAGIAKLRIGGSLFWFKWNIPLKWQLYFWLSLKSCVISAKPSCYEIHPQTYVSGFSICR